MHPDYSQYSPIFSPTGFFRIIATRCPFAKLYTKKHENATKGNYFAQRIHLETLKVHFSLVYGEHWYSLMHAAEVLATRNIYGNIGKWHTQMPA